MNIVEIIYKKKNNQALSKEEIDFFVQGYTEGKIEDYQMSALLMAICINGMNDEEILNLTMSIVNSGDVMDLSSVNGVTVDKHSTGGVGDKTTLVVAPIVAALGGKVVKMSGKGLGHTGGTTDKLESIEGFNTQLSQAELINQVNEIGLCNVSQSGNLTPADKKLYALRDVTGTVECTALIASSVMSKKIAAGSDGIVLDVKMGSGAFMKDIEAARELAQKMVTIGKGAGKKVVALITNMDVPLGNTIGNSLEVKEAIEVLKGNGPKDLTETCIELATYMLNIGDGANCSKLNIGDTPDCQNANKSKCRAMVEEVISNGKALEKLKEMVRFQGGNVEVIDNPDLFKAPLYKKEILSLDSGYIKKMDAKLIGMVACNCGAGRTTKESSIDYTAGIVLNKKVGDYVEKGELLATLYSSTVENFEAQEKDYHSAITFSNDLPQLEPLIYEVIE